MNRKNATRNALFTSILSLLLCVSMLVGTSFAWFTDSVESGVNVINAGNLDVELYNGNTKVGEKTKLFEEVELWEPGAVAYENFTVKNEGNLALKYELTLNFANATENSEGHTLADVLKVAVVKNGFDGDREDVNDLDFNQSLSTFTLSGELKEHNNSDTYGIVIYWEPSENDDDYNMKNVAKNGDGSAVNALKIDLGVSLFATQLTHESDSFDDKYDVNAGKAETEPDPTEPEPGETPVQKLQDALNAGGEVELNEDITLAAGESLSITSNVTLNLNGHTITAAGDALVVTSGTLTLEGEGKVAAGESGVGSWNAVWADGGHVIINGGTYSVGGDTEVAGTDSTHQNDVIYTKNGGTAVINDGTFLNDGTVWTLNENDSNRNTITVYGGTFQGWNPANNVSEGANTNFVAEGYAATAETKSDGTWYTVKKASEEITLTAGITADTFVTSNNKETPYNDSKELSVRTGGTTSKIYYRSYFQVDFEVIATQGFNKDNAKVTFTFTRIAGSADNNTGFTMKAFADVTDIDFANLNWTEVKEGTYADELGWTSDAATTLEPVISVEGDTITITVDYSDIENKAIFAFTSDSSDLEIASTETTIAGAAPVVSVTYTPAAE